MNRKLIVLIVLVGAMLGIAITGFGLYGYANSIRNDGIAQEQQLSKTYEDNQNYLSGYVSTFYEQFGLAKYKTAAMDTILMHAVQGRYGPNGFQNHGAFFSAVAEAYPQLTELHSFDQIMETVAAGRTEFRGRQSLLLDQLRAYDTWRQQGLVRHIVLSSVFHFPSEQLVARVGGNELARSDAALAMFHRIVITGSTDTAFTTGRQAPLSVH